MRKLLRKRMKRAQGMTEYIIIVGLIAIVLITAVKLFGGEVKKGFEKGKATIETEVINEIPGG
jgi:Flp pilus assembly pilin Flp